VAGQCFRYWSGYHEAMRDLTDEQAGALVKALGALAFEGAEPEFSDPTLRVVFKVMREQVETSRDISDRAREAGAKGGRPKAEAGGRKSTAKRSAKRGAKRGALSSAKRGAESEEKRRESKRLLHGLDDAAPEGASSTAEDPYELPPDYDD
jgi:hypothetical protein